MIPVDWKSLFQPPHVGGSRSGHATPSRNSRTVRIEWSDCDPAGIIFYPRYFEIFDASTAALFERALGMTMIEQLRHFDFAGYPLALTRAQFRRPTRYGDDVVVDSTVTFSRASFEVEHRLSLNGIVCVECSETRIWAARDSATGDLKAHPVPGGVLEKFR
jgi:4-hydroxybenzoyl-CoA thioesterase